MTYKFKSETDLYELAKSKTRAYSLDLSPGAHTHTHTSIQEPTRSTCRQVPPPPPLSRPASPSLLCILPLLVWDQAVAAAEFLCTRVCAARRWWRALRHCGTVALREAGCGADGELLGCMCADEQIRIWKCLTGKLYKKMDESLAAAAAAQAADGPNSLDALDFGKRMSVEKELVRDMAAASASGGGLLQRPNLVFDQSGKLIMYAALPGIKVPSVCLPSSVPLLYARVCVCARARWQSSEARWCGGEGVTTSAAGSCTRSSTWSKTR